MAEQEADGVYNGQRKEKRAQTAAGRCVSGYSYEARCSETFLPPTPCSARVCPHSQEFSNAVHRPRAVGSSSKPAVRRWCCVCTYVATATPQGGYAAELAAAAMMNAKAYADTDAETAQSLRKEATPISVRTLDR